MHHLLLTVLSLFQQCLVLAVPIYCNCYVLFSDTHFSFVLILVPATHFKPFYLLNNCMSCSAKLLMPAHQISYQVVLSASHMG